MKRYITALVFLVLLITGVDAAYAQLIPCPDMSSECIDAPPGSQWYWRDNDFDGIGSQDSGGACKVNPGAGWALSCDDCNDYNASIGGPTMWYPDADNDGFGAPLGGQLSCSEPTDGGINWVQNNDDCNDSDPNIEDETRWYRDSDGDGFGDPNVFQDSCTQPIGYVDNNHDCNDNDPGTTTNIYYADVDGDGFGDPNNTTTGCSPPLGHVTNNTDCDDNNDEIHPNTQWYPDADGDGYGNHSTLPMVQCEQPAGYVIGEADCDDTDASLNPETIWYVDSDGDGYGDDPNNFIIQCEDPGAGYVRDLPPVDPVPEDPLPVYPGLNVNDLNFIHIIEPYEEVTNVFNLSMLPAEDKLQNKEFFDGMGRPMQRISIGQGGHGQDIISYIEYDRFGRTVKEYLPYGRNNSSGGVFRPEARMETFDFYSIGSIANSYVATDDPFSESVYDRSPRSRMVRQGGAGDSWQIGNGNEIEYDYKLNSAGNVRLYRVALNASFYPTLVDDGSFYPAGELAINIVKDENWVGGVNNTTEEFINKEGLTVLRRTYVDGVRLSTYYVYDEFNNLTYIIPPKAEPETGSITPTVLNDLCYQFRYDGLRRQTAKRSPDVSGWERVIYDHEDRPILVRDPGLAATGKWHFTKYDDLGRVVYTGLYTPPASRTPEELQSDADTSKMSSGTHNEAPGTSIIGGITIGYTNNAYPTMGLELLTVNYYDNYSFPDPDLPVTPTSVLGEPVTTNVHGLPVATWSRIIGETTWNKAYTYYDEKARELQTINKNHLGGYTKVVSEYNFRGKVTKSIKSQKRVAADTEINVTNRFIYDQAERLKGQYEQVDNHAEKLLNGFVYDAIGQLLVKYVEPEDESFGFEYTIAGLSKGGTTTFNGEVPGNWKEDGKLVTLGTKGQQLVMGATYQGTGINGFYSLDAGKDYVISMDLDIGSFDPDLEFSIWYGGTKLYFETVQHSGGFSASFTPTQSGTHYLSFTMSGANSSGLEQILMLDNVMVQEDVNSSAAKLQIMNVNALQQVDFRYNPKGWLTHINNADDFTLGNDLFALKINYDVIEGLVGIDSRPNFNGNISQVLWKSAFDNVKRDYEYKYDALNRLQNADFSNSGYDLNNVDYDKNGNITALNRMMTSVQQNFIYDYDNGNKLIGIAGSETSGGVVSIINRTYTYDVNGNLKTDSSKGITNIEYNHLNLPETITFSSGETIDYEYDASGVKLQKRFNDGSSTFITDYINGFQYLDGSLQFFAQAEGYAVPSVVTVDGLQVDYVHQYADNLGNIRLSYSDADGDGTVTASEIVKENHYYPFGLIHKGYGPATLPLGSIHKYGFNNKELQEENDLKWLDFGSRNFDPELGRWFNTDPQGQFHSPYAYAFNNPVSSVDPDGEFAVPLILGSLAIGAVTTAISNPRADFTDILSGGIRSAAISIFTSGIGDIFSGPGAILANDAASQLVVKSAAHGVFQGGVAAIQGGDFWSAAATSAFASAAAGTLPAGDHGGSFLSAANLANMGGTALIGGFISEGTGGSFIEGFATSLTIATFNDALHRTALALQASNGIVGFYGAGGKKAGDNPELERIVKGKGGKMFGWKNNQIRKALRYLRKASQNGKTIELYGYSRGGNAAVRVSNQLGEENIFVSKLVLFDPHILWDDHHFVLSGANAYNVYNFYQQNERTSGQYGWWGSNPYWGSPVEREYGSMVRVHQYNFTGHKYSSGRDVSHLNIIRHVTTNLGFKF